MPKVRILGGSHAGEEMQWDVDSRGPVMRLPCMTNCDFAPPYGPDTSKTVPVEAYKIEPVHFASGHVHHYAVPQDGWLVGQFNAMWWEYKTAMRMPPRDIFDRTAARLTRAAGESNGTTTALVDMVELPLSELHRLMNEVASLRKRLRGD